MSRTTTLRLTLPARCTRQEPLLPRQSRLRMPPHSPSTGRVRARVSASYSTLRPQAWSCRDSFLAVGWQLNVGAAHGSDRPTQSNALRQTPPRNCVGHSFRRWKRAPTRSSTRVDNRWQRDVAVRCVRQRREKRQSRVSAPGRCRGTPMQSRRSPRRLPLGLVADARRPDWRISIVGSRVKSVEGSVVFVLTQ
jgi:hypothetical protein